MISIIEKIVFKEVDLSSQGYDVILYFHIILNGIIDAWVMAIMFNIISVLQFGKIILSVINLFEDLSHFITHITKNEEVDNVCIYFR